MRRRIRKVQGIGVLRLVLGAIVVIIAVAASLSGYAASKQNTTTQSTFGDFDNPDRVDVSAWITRVDASTQALAVTMLEIRPHGVLSQNDTSVFATDAALLTNAVGNWKTAIKAGDSAPDSEQRIQIDGAFTNYPFDNYQTALNIHVTNADGVELPVALTVYNSDPFFQISPASAPSQDGGTVVSLDIRRSPPTVIFAVFIMVLMLGLAAAAAVAGYYVLHWKRGLIFPACSMMAAILFALIPLRNAVPGAPPIGSIIDFGSFFIAEAVISISLISGILLGFRHQLAIERAENEADELTTEPEPAPRV